MSYPKPWKSYADQLDQLIDRGMAVTDRARALDYLPQTPEVAWDVSVATLAGLGRLPWRDDARADHHHALSLLQLRMNSLRIGTATQRVYVTQIGSRYAQ